MVSPMIAQSASAVTIRPTVTLYRPTDAEIDSVLRTAQRAWPQLQDRIADAADILRAGLTVDAVAWERINSVRWTIPSHTKHGLVYSVLGSRHNCNCQDSTPLVADGRRLCKHAIAVAAYIRILRDRLNQDIRAWEVRLSALHTGECDAYAKRLAFCLVRCDEQGVYQFCDEVSPVRYAIWRAWQDATQVLTSAEVAS